MSSDLTPLLHRALLPAFWLAWSFYWWISSIDVKATVRIVSAELDRLATHRVTGECSGSSGDPADPELPDELLFSYRSGPGVLVNAGTSCAGAATNGSLRTDGLGTLPRILAALPR